MTDQIESKKSAADLIDGVTPLIWSEARAKHMILQSHGAGAP